MNDIRGQSAYADEYLPRSRGRELLHARRAARLAGLDELIDDIGTRADEILERTLAILDEEAATTGRVQSTSDIRAADF
ncbi:hypothetical protein [Tomitella cavernea]|uniref:Uncharacterized protein n=1 Tax=Tomitella cavernea TaxID=1387982 RepID=A0ABP9CU86_9ACTN|nr:hypothetical protein [Tomitella cavernea]